MAGTYVVNTKTDPLTLREGAGSDKPKIASLPKGSKVNCYGYYTKVDDTKWFLVSTGYGIGYIHSGYLKRV